MKQPWNFTVRLAEAVLLIWCALLVVVAAGTAPAASRTRRTNLDSGWKLSNANASVSISDITVPTCVHAELQRAGIISDPLAGWNEQACQWVAKDTWTFTLSFSYKPIDPAYPEEAHLVFKGIDTIALVLVNGKQLGSVSNMFCHFVYDAGAVLRLGDNTLQVVISSPLTHAARQQAAYPYPIYEPHFYHVWDEPSHRNFIRKAGMDFGWDWGPALASSGIWKEVYLEQTSQPLVKVFTVNQRHVEQKLASRTSLTVYLDVIASIYSPATTVAGTLTASMGSTPGDAIIQPVSKRVTLSQGGNVLEPITLEVKDAKKRELLWWPRGYGGQPLLPVTVTFTVEPTVSHSLTKNIGLRNITLVRDKIPDSDGGGETFFFRVNGVDVFARGANMIPPTATHAMGAGPPPGSLFKRSPEQAARDLVASAVAGRFNMLRMWGGGIYPSEALMDACDEAGILVWMELAFACASYPRNEEFLESVRMEVLQQVMTLQHHASVAIWGGNNEVEALLEWDDFKSGGFDRDVATGDITKLFVDTLRPLVQDVDPNTPWVDSSPSNGVLSYDPYVKRWGSSSDPRYGDVHFYNYAADCMDPDIYPKAKFISEFGFQSLPSFTAWKEDIRDAHELALDSKLLDARQRHQGGTQQMLAQMQRYFKLPWGAEPSNELGLAAAKQRFEDQCWLSQVQQGLCYETAVHTWRRLQHDTSARTMGVLYWQLNDVWNAPSWASVEASGRWKLLHSFARRFFAPLLVSARIVHHGGAATGGAHGGLAASVQVNINNDLPYPVEGTATFEVWGFGDRSGPRNTAARQLSFHVPAHSASGTSSTRGLVEGVAALLAAGNCASPQACFVRVVTSVGRASSSSMGRASSGGGVNVASLSGGRNGTDRGFLQAVATGEDTVDEGDEDLEPPPVLIFLTPLKDAVGLRDPEVSVTDVEGESPRSAVITLKASSVALFVTLEAPPFDAHGYFDYNAFHMVPHETVTVIFTLHDTWPEDLDHFSFAKALRVRSLGDLYSPLRHTAARKSGSKDGTPATDEEDELLLASGDATGTGDSIGGARRHSTATTGAGQGADAGGDKAHGGGLSWGGILVRVVLWPVFAAMPAGALLLAWRKLAVRRGGSVHPGWSRPHTGKSV
eukprot:jgi/Mesvir1/860/Mv17431-RA.1